MFDAQQHLYEQIPGVVLAYPGWLQAYRSDRFEGWTPAPGDQGYLLPGYNYESAITVRTPLSAVSPPGHVNSTGIGTASRRIFPSKLTSLKRAFRDKP